MVLIGCAILPHGSMILDPTIDDIPAGVDELHSAAKYVGDYVRDHEPDIIVIATPHGLNLSESIGVYASNIGIGTADWNKYWSDFRVSCNFHDEFAMDIYNHLQVIYKYSSKDTRSRPGINIITNERRSELLIILNTFRRKG